MNKKRPLGHGLTGYSGLNINGNFHISASYSNNGMLFVEKINDIGRWRRAIKPKKNEKIITCCKCKRPAILLDHFYPYHIDHNLCEIHQKEL